MTIYANRVYANKIGDLHIVTLDEVMTETKLGRPTK